MGSQQASRAALGAGPGFPNLPDIELLSLLGSGAHGTTYRARHAGRLCAVKVEPWVPENEREQRVRNVRREAALLACLDHPGLPKVHAVGEAEGSPYIVMELVEGERLADALARQWSEVELLALGRALAEALAEVHRHGLVHRDLKPANVLLDARGQPRLIDFGLATRVGDGGAAQGALVGSLNYMAPEQSGALERAVDGRADLYSLGIVLFECATGHVPFVSAEAAELIRMHATLPAADLRRVREDLSPAFAQLVAKLLAKDPDDRHASAELLAAELRRLEALSPAERLTTSLAFAGRLAPIPSLDFATLFGREAELELLYSAHDRAQRGHCGIVLVAGPAGQGKSHLVQAFVHDRAGVGLMRAKCDQGESVPLGPLRRALSAYLAQNLDAGGAARRAHVVQNASALVSQLCPQEAARFGIEQRAPSAERDDELLEDVVSLLLELARAAQPLVIWIDDVQWLDSASQRVLYRLANEATHAPLLCVATVRDGEREHELVRTLGAQASEIVHIELAPLGADSVRRILRQMLGSASVGDDVVQKLHECSRGSPFSLRQYTRALLDAGGLTPAWGTWQLDPKALELLPLPEDVLDLVLARVGELGSETKQVLQCAAVLGQSFRFELLRELTKGLPVELCLHQALSRELLVRAEGGHAFVHDRVREALLKDLSEEALKNLHDRVAEVLERGPSEDVFALARHYARSHWERKPEGALAASERAGRAALATFAFEEAHNFLRLADQVITRFNLPQAADFDEVLSEAALRAGYVEEAIERLEQALTRAQTPLSRGRLRGRLCILHRTNLDLPSMRRHLDAAFHELSIPVPGKSVFSFIHALLMWVWFLIVDRLRIGFGTLSGEAADLVRMQLQLYTAQLEFGALDDSPLMLLESTLFGLWPAHRLGARAEYAQFLSRYAATLYVAGARNAAKRIMRRAIRTASDAQDPVGVAAAELYRAFSVFSAKFASDGCVLLGEVMERHGRWLPLNDYLTVCEIMYASRSLEGRAREAMVWIERAQRRAEPTRSLTRSTRIHRHLDLYPQAALALLGRKQEASRAHGTARELVDSAPLAWTHHNIYVSNAIIYLLEQEELGDQLDTLLADYEALGVAPGHVINIFDRFWILLGYARLAQLRVASSEDRPRRLRQLEHAIRKVRKVARWGLYAAHREVIEGAYHAQHGRLSRAQKHLERGGVIAERDDNPWAVYESLVWRARVALRTEHPQMARGLSELAFMVSDSQGWLPRSRRVQREFNLTPTSRQASRSDGASSTSLSEQDVRSLRRRRQLEALLHQGLDASSLLEPDRQARRILDDLVRVFDADHALLFVMPEGESELVLSIGRGQRGVDITETSAFSKKLVERVIASRKPMVVTGDPHAELSAQSSIVTHGLRSVMAAPLLLGERVVGAVHLDSRLARGMFTAGDADVLAAMTQHLAIAQEMARVARMEIERNVLEQDLQLSAAVQALLLPEHTLDQRGPLSLAAHYQPASSASGDFWTYHWLPDGRLRVLLGDVTGHGVASAMVSAAISGCYRALARAPELDTRGLLGELNGALKEMCDGHYEMTATALEIHPEGRATVYSAGAPPPLVVRAGTAVEVVGSMGRPLGSPELILGESHADLAAGDLVVLFSDGLTELSIASGRQFGLRRLQKTLCTGAPLSPEQTRTALRERVDALCERGSQEDDVTFVIVGLSR